MAKSKKASGSTSSVRHSVKAPCAQGFNIKGSSGKKKKSWWNGYSRPAQVADAAE